ncbi:MAG: ribokinase [Planctomycetes bacterium]|nr:ribokinase [Planctomycetota bacterium]
MNGERPTVVVLGSLNMDLVVRVERFPEPGETLLGGGFATFPGGKGANQAVAAARLGANVRMLGRVGDDAYGRELVAGLRRDDVDASRVSSSSAAPTGVAVITVDAHGENHIVVAAGANATLDARAIESASAAFEGARVFVAQLETPLDAVLAGARAARAAGAVAILNAAPAQELSADALAAFDVLVVNQSEAARLAGRRADPETLARELARRGPRAVVITLGAAGALALVDGRVERRAAFDVPVRDATAAGDAFVGALACSLAERVSWPTALARASAAGALACTRAGAQPSLPNAVELRDFLTPRV